MRLVFSACAIGLGAQDPRTLRPQQTAAEPAAPEARTALVIGNGAYQDAPLKNPVNDAKAMAGALQGCGFAVTELENANRAQMREAIRAFGARIAEGGVGLFYFAGHGMQVKGRNFLVPVGADIAQEDEVEGEAVEVDTILAKMETARNRLNILILDACRNNPFGHSFRSTQQGLAQVDAPVGTFVAFATAPGRTAADGGGDHGLYTEALLRQFRNPGVKLEDVFKRTRAEVLKGSAQQQTPWENSSIVGDFYFVPGAAAPTSASAPASPSVPTPTLPSVYQPHPPAGQAPAPSPAEAKLLDLIRTDRGSTMPIKAAAKPLAAQGSLYGQFALGWISKENGVYYRASSQGAKQGIPLAMVFLAEFLADSPVSPEDSVEARKWLNKGIALGEPHAKFMLGKLLMKGRLGTKDIPEAERLFGEVTRENPAYCAVVGECYWQDLTEAIPAQVANAKGLAYYRRAADMGDPGAMWTLGYAYQQGWHVPANAFTSQNWYTDGAAYGDVRCMDDLGTIFLQKHDGKRAAEWFQRAADKGDPYAMSQLADLYREGKDIPEDLPKALALYRKAGEKNDGLSQKHLGELYEKGLGVPRSYTQAYFWYLRGIDCTEMDNEKQELTQDRDRVAAKLSPAERVKLEAQAAKYKPGEDD
jgi:TPR repeat protein